MTDKAETTYLKFTNDISADSADKLEHTVVDLMNNGIQDVHLLLSSSGGNVDVGIELHNMLKALPINLTTHNIGTVDSIANVVFLAGKQRLATPNARFMMHGVVRTFRANADGRVSLDAGDLKSALQYIERDQRRIAETIAACSSMTVEQIIEVMDKEDTLYTPQEAQKLGLVHAVQELDQLTAGKIIRM